MMSTILAVWFAVYEIKLDENGFSMSLAIISLVISAGLIFYGIKVYKKFKTI